MIQTARLAFQVSLTCFYRDATYLNNSSSDSVAALRASGHLYHPKHDPDTQAAIDRAVAEFEAGNGPQSGSPVGEGISFENPGTVSVPAATLQEGAFTSCPLDSKADVLSSIHCHQRIRTNHEGTLGRSCPSPARARLGT